MEIIRHMSNEELADLSIDSDRRALRETFDALPGWAQVATENNQEFWQNQRAGVWARISQAERRSARLPILGWALAAVTIAASGWLLNRPSDLRPHQVRVDPDHELLLEVERAVQTDGPLALEPAALLAEEMVQDLPSRNYIIRKKEPRNEN